MKEVKKYYPDHHKIKKLFKLFPDPEIDLPKYKHNLWPHYYRDLDVLNYYTEIIKKYECVHTIYILIERIYDSYDLCKNIKSTFLSLKTKFENKNELINSICKILSGCSWFYRFDDIDSLFLKYYEWSNDILAKMYFIYCIIVYCPEEGKKLLDDIESYL